VLSIRSIRELEWVSAVSGGGGLGTLEEWRSGRKRRRLVRGECGIGRG
jgi:hypothetical protein